jgi:hypothetical protein
MTGRLLIVKWEFLPGASLIIIIIAKGAIQAGPTLKLLRIDADPQGRRNCASGRAELPAGTTIRSPARQETSRHDLCLSQVNCLGDPRDHDGVVTAPGHNQFDPMTSLPDVEMQAARRR